MCCGMCCQLFHSTCCYNQLTQSSRGLFLFSFFFSHFFLLLSFFFVFPHLSFFIFSTLLPSSSFFPPMLIFSSLLTHPPLPLQTTDESVLKKARLLGDMHVKGLKQKSALFQMMKDASKKLEVCVCLFSLCFS